ncbi:MAG: hypothetical protein Q7S19_01935, partial [bacterium]|nr:hypothetical protein [bacterium]
MSAKSVRGSAIGYHQGHEFLKVLEKAGLTGDIAQDVINSRGNQKAKLMMSTLEGVILRDERFTLVKSFGMTVPENYESHNRLDIFRAECEKEFYYYNPNITDANYGHPSLKLSPGLKFMVKVFQITDTVSSDDCLKFLKAEKGVLL